MWLRWAAGEPEGAYFAAEMAFHNLFGECLLLTEAV
jgi:hypothetical protein